MTVVDLLLYGAAQLLTHWPLLLLVIGGQLAHELTHFAAARAVGAEAIIQIRLRTPMRVRYDESGVTPGQAVFIGLAPTLAGLTAMAAWVWSAGWPQMTPLTVAALVAWVLYTTPSGPDAAPLGPWLAPDGHEEMPEPLRSGLIGGSVIALGAWLPALPYPARYTMAAAIGIALGGLAFMAIAAYEHGVPEGSLVD